MSARLGLVVELREIGHHFVFPGGDLGDRLDLGAGADVELVDVALVVVVVGSH